MTTIYDPIHGRALLPGNVIPEVFGEAISYEDKLICIIRWVNKTFGWYVTKDQLEQALQGVNGAIDKLRQDMNITADQLRVLIESLAKQQAVYNPTKGKYEDSKTVNRDMYRELAVYGATVDQMASLTVEEAAQHESIEIPLIGNRTIFGATEPKANGITGGNK